jgi:hypothetical protein
MNTSLVKWIKSVQPLYLLITANFGDVLQNLGKYFEKFEGGRENFQEIVLHPHPPFPQSVCPWVNSASRGSGSPHSPKNPQKPLAF